MVCELYHSVPDLEVDEPQTRLPNSVAPVSVTLEHEQHKQAKASTDATPVQSMSVPKRTPVKAVLAAPLLELKDTQRSDHTFHSIKESDREFDANLSWKPREGRSEDIMVVVGELESYLLTPSDVAGIITVLAENACDGGGYRKFVFIKRSEGIVVAVAGRYAALQENQESNNRELHEAIAHMKTKQSRLLATVEQKQHLMSGAPEEIRRKVIQNVLVLDDKISEVEIELLETSEDENGGGCGLLTGPESFSRSCRRARTSFGGSSCQSKDKDGSHCRTCAPPLPPISA